jgi:hypothetical protein
VSSVPRFRECGWKPTGKNRPAELAARGGVASWRGVRRCGSIHACPVDAAQIRNFRAVEISHATAIWIDAGNEAYMVTFTASHNLMMGLAALLTLISRAFSRVIAGRAWRDLKDGLGIVGTVRSLEVTHGGRGWHPHLHVLVYVEGALDACGLARFDAYFRQQWRRFITATCQDCGQLKGRGKDACTCGGPGYPPPSDQHGVKIERCYSGEGAAEYICKTQEGHNLGAEMARADQKTARGEHRVPFQILASAAEGNERDLRLWHEFEQATKGRKCITWSNHLRDIIWAVAPVTEPDPDWLVELTDEDIVGLESMDGETVARVSRLAMRRGRSIPGFRVTLQEAFEDGGVDGLAATVRRLGFEVLWDRDPLIPLIVPAHDVAWPIGDDP